MVMPEPLYWQTTQVYGHKTWPYGESINNIITHVAQSGIAQYWEYKAGINTMDYTIQKNIDENGNPPDGDDPVRLSIEHVLGEIIILGMGYFGAFFVFLGEIIYFHWNKRRIVKRKAFKLVSNNTKISQKPKNVNMDKMGGERQRKI